MSSEDFSVAVSGDDIPDESVLVEAVREALSRGAKRVNILNGFTVGTDSTIRVVTGPVLGDVTSSSAILMLEVTGSEGGKFIPVSVALYAEGDDETPVAVVEQEARARRPVIFHFEELEPATNYTAVINGVCKYHATTRMARFKTKSESPSSFRFFALSCDRPSRLLLGQQNPWLHMLKRCKDVDVILHAGDQIYPDNEDIAHADGIFNDIYDGLAEDKQRSMRFRGRELWRNKYRTVFSSEGKQELMSRVSNLMVWSDNDVANDFTTMKDGEGEQKYHPEFLRCGMRTYREYQRRLWEPDCRLALAEEVAEWHSHVYGQIGIFMFDLRGNRIDGAGNQMSDNPLLSDAQWEALEGLFADEELRAIVLVSETPFVGDEPGVCQEKVAGDPNMDFLKDHWPYNEGELVRLLDLSFDWMAAGESSGRGREVLMIGGDIHCGVTSVIRDEETGLQINHLTTSPVTNHVCKFFPPVQGDISERYNFSHLPLGRKFRNYADVTITLTEEDDVRIQAQLVPISTDIFKDNTWNIDDSEEEEEEEE